MRKCVNHLNVTLKWVVSLSLWRKRISFHIKPLQNQPVKHCAVQCTRIYIYVYIHWIHSHNITSHLLMLCHILHFSGNTTAATLCSHAQWCDNHFSHNSRSTSSFYVIYGNDMSTSRTERGRAKDWYGTWLASMHAHIIMYTWLIHTSCKCTCSLKTQLNKIILISFIHRSIHASIRPSVRPSVHPLKPLTIDARLSLIWHTFAIRINCSIFDFRLPILRIMHMVMMISIKPNEKIIMMWWMSWSWYIKITWTTDEIK